MASTPQKSLQPTPPVSGARAAAPAWEDPVERERRRGAPRRRQFLLILAVMLLLLTGGVTLSLMLMSRGPLSGETYHDFGTLMLEGNAVTGAHTFTLTNTSGRSLQIAKVHRTCGCTTASYPEGIIEPGERVAIETELSITGAGRKHSALTLLFEDGSQQPLTLEGVARRIQRIWAPRETIAFRDDPAMTTLLIAEVYGDSEPRLVSHEAPDGVNISFGTWTQRAAPKKSIARPGRWETLLTIARAGGPTNASDITALPEGAAIELAYEIDGETQRLRLLIERDESEMDLPLDAPID